MGRSLIRFQLISLCCYRSRTTLLFLEPRSNNPASVFVRRSSFLSKLATALLFPSRRRREVANETRGCSLIWEHYSACMHCAHLPAGIGGAFASGASPRAAVRRRAARCAVVRRAAPEFVALFGTWHGSPQRCRSTGDKRDALPLHWRRTRRSATIGLIIPKR